MTKNGGYLAGQKAKPPLTAGVADVSIPRPRRGAGWQRARAVRETGTQKSPLTAKSVRAILRLCTLQMPCPRRDTGGPGVRVIRATGKQNRRRPRSLSGRLGSVRASSACPRRNANRRVRRPGHPSDGNAKTAADREACQGGLGSVRASSARPRRNVGRRPGVRCRPGDGNTKPPPTAKPIRAVGVCPRFKRPSPKERRRAGQASGSSERRERKNRRRPRSLSGRLGTCPRFKRPSPKERR